MTFRPLTKISPSSAIRRSKFLKIFPAVPGLASERGLKEIIGAVSVIPYPSQMVIPKVKKSFATCSSNLDPPETKYRNFPPNF